MLIWWIFREIVSPRYSDDEECYNDLTELHVGYNNFFSSEMIWRKKSFNSHQRTIEWNLNVEMIQKPIAIMEQWFHREKGSLSIFVRIQKRKKERNFRWDQSSSAEMLFWCSWAKVTTSSTTTAIIITLTLELVVPQHFLYSCPFWIVDIVIGCYPTLESRNTVINPFSIFSNVKRKKNVLTLVQDFC